MDEINNKNHTRARATIWDLLRQGEVSQERVIKACKDNLKIVWKEVKNLIEKLFRLQIMETYLENVGFMDMGVL